jgi:hypothetical protein
LELKGYKENFSIIVDWIILILLIIMILVIFIPKKIWNIEGKYRNLAHFKMKMLWNAEVFHQRLTGNYTPDLKEAISLVSMVKDSLIADSTFIGEQYVQFPDTVVKVNIDRSYRNPSPTTYQCSL